MISTGAALNSSTSDVMRTKPLNNLNTTMLKLRKSSGGLWLACAAAAVLCLCQTAKAQIADGLEAYWNFDGDNFLDLIGGFDGTPQGSTPIAFVAGQAGFGRAIQLDGEDQYVLISGEAPPI
jgi:hypothetical protein